MTAKEFKQLNCAYKKSFINIQKAYTVDKSFGLVFFAEYLRYLRDFIILHKYNDNLDESKLTIASIIAAIAEFDAYSSCDDKKQRDFHWNSFCELVKQNMEDWLSIDDSV